MPEGKVIGLTKKAYDRLTHAKREDESLSDVIVRLTSHTLDGLRRRGEMEVITSDRMRLSVSVDQGKCLGAMSCVSLAPSVFAIDTSQLGMSRRASEPLGMRETEGEIDSETLIQAAKSCPYQAISLRDVRSGVDLAP